MDDIIIGGGKGDVEKLMACVGMIDTTRAPGESPLLVESDTSPPDVWKMYEKEVRANLSTWAMPTAGLTSSPPATPAAPAP